MAVYNQLVGCIQPYLVVILVAIIVNICNNMIFNHIYFHEFQA